MNKAPQTYWDETNATFEFEEPASTDPIRSIIEMHIPPTQEAEAIEIGCYPGKYLTIFGRLGYTLNGIDTTPRTFETANHLQQSGYKTGTIKKVDFFRFRDDKLYQVVSSFGFVEHFENYLDVINKHCNLVSPEGYLVVGAPNFRHGLQYFFHSLFNTKSLRRHNLKSMAPFEWELYLKKNGFKVLWANYCGGLQWWMEKDQTKTQRFLGLFFLRLLKLVKGVLFWMNFEKINNKYISCYFLVIAQRLV